MTQGAAGRTEPGLVEFLTQARGASDRRLVTDAVGGIVVVAAVLVWRPPWGLVVLLAGLCFASFGCWGILDRELQEGPGAGRRVFRLLKWVAVVVGTLAAVGMVLVATAVAVGGFTH